MRYNKTATSIDEQLNLLKQRGMKCGDAQLIKRWLKTVGYYRLSAYWFQYEKHPDAGQTRSKIFHEGTKFEKIVDIYTFDRQLRLLVSEAVERIEIALRASWTYHMVLKYGPHVHLNREAFDSREAHSKLVSAIKARAERSGEVFVKHYRDKYSLPSMPPLWAVSELMTFGELSQWVSSTANSQIRSAVAEDLGLPTIEALKGTIQMIAYVRNMCAHHARLWNRRFVKRSPSIKRFKDDLAIDVSEGQVQPQNSVYNVLVILARLLVHQSPDTTFPQRVKCLAETRSNDELERMGFPSEWKSRPIWREK